jgi:chloramphenicol 3-O phosphotransferase
MIIVLNGTSSSGKSVIARAIQERAETTFLNFSTDDILSTLPPRLQQGMMKGEPIGKESYGALVRSYYGCVKQLADDGHSLVIDNAITSLHTARLLVEAVRGHDVVLVGVDCAVEIAAAREAARGDRAPGLAASQAESIHKWLAYDVRVDSGKFSPDSNADAILGALSAPHDGLERMRQLLAQ